MADLALALAPPAAAKTAIAATPASATKADGTTTKAAPFALAMAATKPAANDPLAALKAAAKGKVADSDAPLTDDLTVSEKPQDETEAKDGSDDATDPTALLSLLTTPAPTPQVITPTPVQAQVAAQQIATPQTASAPVVQLQVDSPRATQSAPVIQLPTALSQKAAPQPQPQSALADLVDLVDLVDSSAQQQAAPQDAPPTTTLTSVSALVAMMTAKDSAPVAAAAPQAASPAPAPQTAAALADVTQLQAAAPQLAAAIAVASKTDSPANQDVTPAPAPAPVAATDDPAIAVPAGAAETAAIATQAAVPVAAKPTTPLVRSVRTMAPKIADTASRAALQQRADTPKADTAPNRSADRAPQTHAAPDRADSASVAAAVAAQQPQRDSAPVSATSATTALSDAGSIEAMTNRQLDLAKGNQWLDSLTRDIVATGGSDSKLSFALSPEHLGALKVEILKGDDGATVNMTTETDHARNIIQDAQPRLVAEARAQGLTLKETNVSTNSDQPSPQQQRQTQSQASMQQSTGQQTGQDRRAFAQSSAPAAPRRPLSTASADTADRDLYA